MSTEMNCPTCNTVIEIPKDYNSNTAFCENCNPELKLEKESINPYSTPQANLKTNTAGEVKFPVICLIMPILIIILEIIRSVAIIETISFINDYIINDRFTVIRFVSFMLDILTMNLIVILGIASSILMLCKIKWASVLSKIYAALIITGALLSIMYFDLKFLILNGLIGIFVTINIIFYNSYLRQIKALEKIEKQRENGSLPRRRIAGKLVKK